MLVYEFYIIIGLFLLLYILLDFFVNVYGRMFLKYVYIYSEGNIYRLFFFQNEWVWGLCNNNGYFDEYLFYWWVYLFCCCLVVLDCCYMFVYYIFYIGSIEKR